MEGPEGLWGGAGGRVEEAGTQEGGMGSRWQVPTGVGLLALLCIGWAASSASLLHLVPSRTEAAWVAVMAWGWGLSAVGAAALAGPRRLPWWPVVLVGVAVRAILCGTPPLLSDDVFRLLWEGQLLAAGGNPFLTAPAAVPGLDDALRAKVNHPEVPSIYPPVALLWFRVLWHGGGTVLTAQIGTALADLAVLGALLWARRGRPTWPALLYALHPLAALESASGAHLDVPAVALLAWACAVRRPAWAGLLVVLGAGTKLLPFLVWPGPAGVQGRRGLPWAVLGSLAGVAALAVLALPVLDAGPRLFDGFRAYATHWSFNGFAWPVAGALAGAWARPVLVGLGGLLTLTAWILLAGRPWALWLAVGSAFVALSPTLHPWYGLWVVVPGLALGRWSPAVAGIALLGAYGVLSGYDAATGAWSEPDWLWPATWVPAGVAVVVELGAEAWARLRRWRASARV
jgi:hypothetical protein